MCLKVIVFDSELKQRSLQIIEAFASHGSIKVFLNFNTKLSCGQKTPTQEENILEVGNIKAMREEKRKEN